MSLLLTFCWLGYVSHDPHQFCEVGVWSGRPEGSESNTITRTVSHQGRPKAARAAKKQSQQPDAEKRNISKAFMNMVCC